MGLPFPRTSPLERSVTAGSRTRWEERKTDRLRRNAEGCRRLADTPGSYTPVGEPPARVDECPQGVGESRRVSGESRKGVFPCRNMGRGTRGGAGEHGKVVPDAGGSSLSSPPFFWEIIIQFSKSSRPQSRVGLIPMRLA